MFLANSEYLTKIKNLADMSRELNLSVYIWGEKGVGKTTLAKYISPNAIINKINTNYPCIIENFDKNPMLYENIPILIATGEKPMDKAILKKYFAFEIELKPLTEHPEDIEFFMEYFLQKAKEELKIDKKIKIQNPDISENLNSLKKQVYKELLKPSMEEIYKILKEYLKEKHSTYEEEINRFEKILFSAMKEKYHSKLQISERLKINRVTLTKKMKALNV
ncbi:MULTISPECIES: Fis family transcriptional regulator [unclassified Lebetimonas]|uniref:Fis family transcriptional regulator n=1 Tax=unclassified Lebetimonas TaxID=2648158 RepID=UPI0004652507|nr:MULTISPECIES: Fis family transcriptional regulator [unclassified Lebetimonas]